MSLRYSRLTVAQQSFADLSDTLFVLIPMASFHFLCVFLLEKTIQVTTLQVHAVLLAEKASVSFVCLIYYPRYSFDFASSIEHLTLVD